MVLEQNKWYVITSSQTSTRIVKIFEPTALPGAHSSLRDEIKCYPTYIEDGEIKKLDPNRMVYMAYDSVCTNYYKLDSLLKADKYLTAEQYHEVVKTLIRPKELLDEAKSRYPVGTRYWPAHLYSGKTDSVEDLAKRSENFVVSNDQKFDIENVNQIFLKNPGGGYFDSERNGEIYNQILYASGIWARKLTSKSNTMANFNTKNGDELLVRLQAKFPIGTRYIPLMPGGGEYEGIHNIKREVTEHGSERYEGGLGFVYIDGREARVMPYGDQVDYQAIEKEARRRYPEGTKYIRLEQSGEVGREAKADGRFRWLERKIDARSHDLLEMGDGYVYVDGKWAELVEKTNSLMSDRELIAEAKRRYPVGTYFISPDDNNAVRKVELYTGNTTIEWKVDPSGKVRCENGMGGPFCSNPHVYYKGKWAEIVPGPKSEPKEEPYVPTREEVLARYPEGTWYLPLKEDGTVGGTPKISKGICITTSQVIWVNNDTGTGYVFDIQRQKWADVVPNPNTVGIDEVQYPQTPQESYFPVERKAVLTKQKASINQVEELPLLKIKSF
jgi:hypothetical protein